MNPKDQVRLDAMNRRLRDAGLANAKTLTEAKKVWRNYCRQNGPEMVLRRMFPPTVKEQE